MATVRQMANRVGGCHLDILHAIETGARVGHVGRGHMTAMRTLAVWGAVEDGSLTDTGRELIATIRGRTRPGQGYYHPIERRPS